ncbi:MAG TPA: Flp family type IVb pilin [Acetobacteraceae bacterium]|jgi:pilus assembly protein Flp/PilA|nr:Flp family type IVb pilin [Acetobacteraceae bacterium]
MLEYLTTWVSLKTDRRGVTALEYGLIAALIAGVIVVAVTAVGVNIGAKFTTLAADLV